MGHHLIGVEARNKAFCELLHRCLGQHLLVYSLARVLNVLNMTCLAGKPA